MQKSNEVLAAPKGNEFWKLRSKHGRDKIFATPEIMLLAAYEYFDWCEKNPLIEIDYRGSSPPVKVQLPKMRPFTKEGLTMFLHVNTVYFNQFEESITGKEDETSKDFSKVITHVKEIIYRQKYEGAASGFLNPNIIARDLGLSEKRELDHKNNGESFNNISDAELIDRITKLATSGKEG